MKQLLIFLLNAALLYSCTLFAQEKTEELTTGQYAIEYENGLVSIQANEANVEALLKDFSEASGISFNRYTGKVETTTLDLDRVDVEEFFKRVLGSYFTRSRKKNGKVVISSVTIFDESPAGSSSSSSAPAAHTRPRAPSSRSRATDNAASRRRRRSRRRPRRAPRRNLNTEGIPSQILEELKKHGASHGIDLPPEVESQPF